MKKISKKSCYYFYGKEWDSWEDLCANFKWEIPEKMNAAFYVCDAHAEDNSTIAIFHEDGDGKKGKITFQELKNITNRLANYIRSQGVNRGDRIAVCLSQRPEALIAHVGAWKLGAVSMPLTVLFGTDGLKYRLEHSDAKIAIVENSVLDSLRKIKHDLKDLKKIIVVGDDSELEEDEIAFGEAMAEMSPDFEPVELDPDDNMVLIYTGGTTGDPKGVVHRHSWIFRGPGHFAALGNAEIRPDDVFWNPADFAWGGPLFDLAFPSLFYGRPLLTYAGGAKFDPEKAFKLIEDYSLTVLYIPPTALRMMRQVNDPSERFELGSVRVLMSGAEAFGKALPEWVLNTFGTKTVVHEAYGQSEGTLLTMNCQRYFEYKYNIGKAVPGLKVEILDDAGNVLPPGEQGEIAIGAFDGSPVVLKEYWKAPEATKEKFKGNWMLTGDTGIKDDDGYFKFVSRKDDIIISSGYRIGPSEVEDTLIKHEAVLEAAVIGVPDKTRGEIPKAFVVLRQGHESTDDLRKELQDFVKQRLAKHEYPRKIEFVVDLPKTTTGKVKRKDLRKMEGIPDK